MLADSFAGGMVRAGRGALGALAVSFERRKRLHDEDTRVRASTAVIAQILITLISRPVSKLGYRPGLLSPAVV